MRVKQKFKHIFLKTPFSWPILAYNAILNHEKNRVRKGSNDYIQSLRNRSWYKDDPDNSRRFNYDLNENSIVFDIGGYNGEYASILSNKYNCIIYIFEPVPSFFKIIKDKFSNNSRIHPLCVGLSDITTKQSISIQDIASSIFIQGGKRIEIQLKDITEFLKETGLNTIDLMKLNIEGAEYALLESLIRNNRISTFKNILVQFHDFIIPDAKVRMMQIQKDLSRTHFLTYSYEFVWENWQLKESK